jgi:hypothetical protein
MTAVTLTPVLLPPSPPSSGVRVDFGYAWYVMVSATGLAFFSALFATCCCTRPSRKLAATPKGRIAQTNDEDLRQIIATY